MTILHVRGGELVEQGSWVYAWLAADGVVYVGATALQPATRTWLHLHDENPEVGRMLARYPTLADEELDVLFMQLADGVDRQQVRHGSVTQLGERGLLSPRHVCDPPAELGASAEADRFVELLAARLAAD